MPVTLDEITTHVVYARGLPGTGMTVAEYSTLRADMDAFLATTIPQALGDLTDVDTATTPPADGDTLVYVLADDEWVPGTVSGAIAFVKAWDWDASSATAEIADVDELRVTQGLTIATSVDPSVAYLLPSYGGTGAAYTVSRSDHTHTTPTTTVTPYAATGTLSSGSRTLITRTPAFAAGVDYLIDAELHTCQRGNGGSSYYTLSITIGGITYTTDDPLQCVGGVPDRPVWVATRTVTGTGAAVTVSASIAYSSGDPLSVDAGWLRLQFRPNR